MECEHPKLKTCKNCKRFTYSNPENYCEWCNHYGNQITQPEIDKFHAEKLKEAKQKYREAIVKGCLQKFQQSADLQMEGDKIIESVMRCLNGTEKT